MSPSRNRSKDDLPVHRTAMAPYGHATVSAAGHLTGPAGAAGLANQEAGRVDRHIGDDPVVVHGESAKDAAGCHFGGAHRDF